jgi:hypothetical protein
MIIASAAPWANRDRGRMQFPSLSGDANMKLWLQLRVFGMSLL